MAGWKRSVNVKGAELAPEPKRRSVMVKSFEKKWVTEYEKNSLYGNVARIRAPLTAIDTTRLSQVLCVY